MVGRTNGQHAQPTTFGVRMATWLDELLRQEARLAEAAGHAATIQLGGMVGTLASVHPKASPGAPRPRSAWASVGRARTGTTPATPSPHWPVRSACSARASHANARDVASLAGTDLAEVYESGNTGRGRSSGMPHKRNPRSAEFAESVARLARHRAGGLVEVMGQEHERAGGSYIAEWVLIPELFALTSAAIDWSVDLYERLEAGP